MTTLAPTTPETVLPMWVDHLKTDVKAVEAKIEEIVEEAVHGEEPVKTS